MLTSIPVRLLNSISVRLDVNGLLPGAEILTDKRNVYCGHVSLPVPQCDQRPREHVLRALQPTDAQLPADTLIAKL